METDKIYFTCHFFDIFFPQSIDFKYTKIRQSKKMRKNFITEKNNGSPTLFPQGFEPLNIHEYTFFVYKIS